jgi:dipeptidyl aminopeptidase/acylaminoacyl peptidase
VPERWDAASLTGQAGRIRSPVLLVYAAGGRLAAQGRAWHRALTAAGTDSKLIMVPGAGHLFASPLAQRQLYQAVLDWCGRPGQRRPPFPAGH